MSGDTWTDVDLLLVRPSGLHLRTISQEVPQPSITTISLNIAYLNFRSNLHGANELNYIPLGKTVKLPVYDAMGSDKMTLISQTTFSNEYLLKDFDVSNTPEIGHREAIDNNSSPVRAGTYTETSINITGWGDGVWPIRSQTIAQLREKMMTLHFILKGCRYKLFISVIIFISKKYRS